MGKSLTVEHELSCDKSKVQQESAFNDFLSRSTQNLNCKFSPQILLRRLKRRCRCPKSSRRVVCRRHDRLEFVTVAFRLSRTRNACVRTVSRQRRPLRCSHRARLLRVIRSGGCRSASGFQVIIRRIFVVARSCRCHRVEKRLRHLCDCRKALPSRSRRFCEAGTRLVKLLLTPTRTPKGCSYQTRRFVQKIRKFKCPWSQCLHLGCMV